jgi:hypothetical protein
MRPIRAVPQAPKLHLVFRDIADWAKGRTVGVSTADLHIADNLRTHGIPYKELVRPGINPHAFSAACREAAVVSILAKAGLGKSVMNCWDVFGSSRTLLLDPSRSGPYGRLPGGQSSRGMKVNWFSGPDTPIAGDASRGTDVRQMDDGNKIFDVVIAVDLYQSGDSSLQAFSPEFALECLSRSTGKTMYWIGRFFNGYAGGDEPLTGPNGEYVEQVFYKNTDNLVVSSPDGSSGEYAPHPWPEWLQHRSFSGLDISPVASYGPYRIVRISETRSGAIALQSMKSPQGQVVEMELDDSSYLMWLLPVYSTKKVKVIMDTFLSVRHKLLRKVPNGQLYDMAHVLVSKEMDKILWVAALRVRAPWAFVELLEGTIAACIFYGRHGDSKQMLSLRQAHVTAEACLVKARAAQNNLPTPWNSKILFAIGIGATCTIAAMKRFSAGAWIVPSRPLLSSLMEEGLAYVSEPAAVVGVLCEATHSWVAGKPQWPLLMHLGAFALRTYGGVIGRVCAVILHFGWNYCTRLQDKKWTLFCEHYETGETFVEENQIVRIPRRATLPSYTTLISSAPRDFRGEVKIWVDGERVEIEEAFHLLGRPSGRNVTFPILITQRLLHQPANNETNLLAAVLHRMHRDPFANCRTDRVTRHDNWLKLGIYVQNLLPCLRNANISIDDNIRAMGRKGRRLQQAVDTDVAGFVSPDTKTVNLKWNETISVRKDIDGIITMKPRSIQNLPALTHALMGGFARSYANELHQFFDGKIWDIDGIPVRIFFASGFDQARLTEIGVAALEGGTVFSMSGDDSAIAWGGLSDHAFGEADQSMADHSQDEGPMKLYLHAILLKLGFPQHFCDLAFRGCSSGYVIRRKRLFVKGHAGTQLPTGTTITTTGNSMSTLGIFIWFILNRKRMTSLTQAGDELGFQVKYFARDRLDTVTFLKGWWQKQGNTVQWIPLPSACLKIGKLLNDPRTITKSIVRGVKRFLDPAEAIAQCASALASSYGTVERDYPILGEFLFTMNRLGKQPKRHLGSLQESWKPVMTGITVDREAVLEAILFRYGITAEEVVSVETLLRTVNTLPMLVIHTVFDKLCDVDY